MPDYKLYKLNNVELVTSNGKKIGGIFISSITVIRKTHTPHYALGRVSQLRSDVTCKLFRKLPKGKTCQPLLPDIFNIYGEFSEIGTGKKTPLCIENARVTHSERVRKLEKFIVNAEKVTIGEGAEKKVVRETFVFR